MINQIIDAIGKKLWELFPDWEIYDYNPIQDLKFPCFIITHLNSTKKYRLNAERVRMTDLFNINVLCPGNPRELRESVEKAVLYLDFLELEEGPIMVQDCRSRIIDDESAIIQFHTAETQWFKEDKTLMRELRFKEIIK